MFQVTTAKLVVFQTLLFVTACLLSTPVLSSFAGDNARPELQLALIVEGAVALSLMAYCNHEILMDAMYCNYKALRWTWLISFAGLLVGAVALHFLPTALSLDDLAVEVIPEGTPHFIVAFFLAPIVSNFATWIVIILMLLSKRRDLTIFLGVAVAVSLGQALDVIVFDAIVFSGFVGRNDAWEVDCFSLVFKIPGMLMMLPWWFLSARAINIAMHRNEPPIALGSGPGTSPGHQSFFYRCRGALRSALKSLKTALKEGDGFGFWFR